MDIDILKSVAQAKFEHTPIYIKNKNYYYKHNNKLIDGSVQNLHDYYIFTEEEADNEVLDILKDILWMIPAWLIIQNINELKDSSKEDEFSQLIEEYVQNNTEHSNSLLVSIIDDFEKFAKDCVKHFGSRGAIIGWNGDEEEHKITVKDLDTNKDVPIFIYVNKW